MNAHTLTDASPQLYDEKMNLPNLAMLMLDLEDRYKRRAMPLHLVCYDIDALRKINFSYGHAVGDELLRQIADWVQSFSHSPLYRIEGDMFCLLLYGKTSTQVQQLTSSAMYRSKGPWIVHTENGAREIFVTAHMGIIPVDDYVLSQNLTDLMERVLDDSRHTRRIALFNQEADEIAQEYIRLQMDLKTCILRDMADFNLVYQPITDPSTGIWVGMEALTRWQRPGRGPVPPLIFIPEVERLGLMQVFGMWVMEKAVSTCRGLGLDSLDDFFLSVNVSASQLQSDFAPRVKGLLARHGYPPHKLNLEITESTEFIFNDTTHGILEELRKLGVTFALDDFGTGYSSFSNMKHLPVRYIKTEREFIYGIEKDNYLQYSLYVISESAHASGMKLIVEGVEDHEVLRCVVKNGADLIQGYHYSEPIDQDALMRQIDRFTTPLACETLDGTENLFNFGRWLRSKDAYNITPGLFDLLNQALDALLNADEPETALHDILGMVGSYFKVNRAFVFLRDEDAVFSNRYEWCAEGVDGQMHLFQKVDGAKDDFFQMLCDEQFIITTHESQLPQDMRGRLESGGQPSSIQSLAVHPIKRKGEILGFVGFDDDEPREWMPEEMLILHNLCLLVLITLDMWGPDGQTHTNE